MTTERREVREYREQRERKQLRSLADLEQLKAERDKIDEQIGLTVETAYGRGVSWLRMARVLGMSAEGVRLRYSAKSPRRGYGRVQS